MIRYMSLRTPLTLWIRQGEPVSYTHLLSETVQYDRNGNFVEFDSDRYFHSIEDMIRKAAGTGKDANAEDVVQIILTGQAESLILLGQDRQPIHPAISWMDMRSGKECAQLSGHFPADLCYHTTGQPELIPTWPITKMLWMREHRPDVFKMCIRDSFRAWVAPKFLLTCSTFRSISSMFHLSFPMVTR